MNQIILLDTNAVIQLFRGANEALRRAISGKTNIVLPLVVYAELKVGIDSAPSEHGPEREFLERMLATPGAEVHRMTERTASFYSRIFNYLRKQGSPIPTNDIWIAAEAMDVGGTLFSDDRHFLKIPMLDLIHS